MDLSTKYLGMDLPSPLVASASPLSKDIAKIKKLEDHGASAVVLYSLFEEQLRLEALELDRNMTQGIESFAESTSYFPEPSQFHLGPEAYLNHIRKAKEAVNIPIIASLNGSTQGGWTDFAKQMQQAGADALELNLYYIPTDPNMSGAQVEDNYVEVVKAVKAAVSVPVAVKLSPYFSNIANMAKRFDEVGADALVLFNRFYQPDIDLEDLDVKPNVLLSTQFAQRLPLRWIAILSGQTKADLAATSGVHQADDVLKMIMVGAKVTMLCSTLYLHGLGQIKEIEHGVKDFLQRREYESLKQAQGSMSQKQVINPSAYERAQYMKGLQSYEL